MPSPHSFKYIGLASQLLATLGVAFFIGYRLDKYLNFHIPILMISLPLIALIALLLKIIRDTSNQKKR